METQARRLNREHLYLPGSFNYEEIEQQLKQLTDALGLPELTEAELTREKESCESALAAAKDLIGDMPVALDYLYHPRPLGLAKLLLTHGFNVKAVYLDGISPEEKDAFDWLQECAPETGTDRNDPGENADVAKRRRKGSACHRTEGSVF